MRQLRELAQGVWYEIHSGINNRELILSQPRAAALFLRVFRETMLCFPFEVRGLRLEADWISFYIKPDDGLELPAIMKRMKQVFAQRYNALTGRTGHIWGDRYWSQILEGEPPEDVGAEAAFGAEIGVRPWRRKQGRGPRFSAVFTAPSAPVPG
jgi:REP element-mobilizing transposase RayT